MTQFADSRYFIDNSRLIIEATVQAGADVFIGYPITPANLLYLYASKRFPVVLPAPDEITTLQWMAGYAAAGRLPVTATSYPGLALMIESIGMSHMMELPMVIILAQRLGPATGTATGGATGDLLLINGINSGGYPIPTLCISDPRDAWDISAKAVQLADRLRCPVILLASKETVMTVQDVDPAVMTPIEPLKRRFYTGEGKYLPYAPEADSVPPLLPVDNTRHQVRITASTHDCKGDLQHTTPEALANSRRLAEKVEKNIDSYTFYDWNDAAGETVVVAYDVTAAAAREAVDRLCSDGKKVSLLIPKTLFPVPPKYLEILGRYKKVIMVEENMQGQYREILFGKSARSGVCSVTAVGRLITPEEIIAEVLS
ncbi:MAG TPA: hypothetical protein VLH18_05810 [Candidatus Limnocylindrales bacterium]|nr:hypothetical protein [Candidatus Limnocylindrales bacterium]